MKAPLVLPANSNKKVAVTGRKQGKTMLLLLGNYGAFVPAATVVTLPGNPKFIKEIKNGKKLSARGNKLAITIPANGYRFLEIGF